MIYFLTYFLFLWSQADDVVMETFYHKDGQIYNCVYQGGQRFYMDWEAQVCILFI